MTQAEIDSLFLLMRSAGHRLTEAQLEYVRTHCTWSIRGYVNSQNAGSDLEKYTVGNRTYYGAWTPIERMAYIEAYLNA